MTGTSDCAAGAQPVHTILIIAVALKLEPMAPLVTVSLIALLEFTAFSNSNQRPGAASTDFPYLPSSRDMHGMRKLAGDALLGVSFSTHCYCPGELG